MTNNDNENLVVDSLVAGGAITMPLWASSLNGWLHLFMALGGSFLIAYRIIKIIRHERDE